MQDMADAVIEVRAALVLLLSGGMVVAEPCGTGGRLLVAGGLPNAVAGDGPCQPEPFHLPAPASLCWHPRQCCV